MVDENPFYTWTIIETWNWLIDLPVLGFVVLVLAGVYVLFLPFVIRSHLLRFCYVGRPN